MHLRLGAKTCLGWRISFHVIPDVSICPYELSEYFEHGEMYAKALHLCVDESGVCVVISVLTHSI